MADIDINPYELLGLSAATGASEAEIQKAYRKLSLKLHPDRNTAPDATAVFQRVTAARDILLDPQARAAYENVQRAQRHRREQDEELAGQSAERASARAAMRAELNRREAEAGTAVSELQRAKAALAQQMARLRREAMAAAAQARPRRPSVTTQPCEPPAKRSKGAPVDSDTLAQLQRSLKVSWRREQAEHDDASLRAALGVHGDVEHVVLRTKRGKVPASAVVVMSTASGAAAAVRGSSGPAGAPLLVTPLPAVANMGALDGGTEAAAVAAASLRREGIAAAAPPPSSSTAPRSSPSRSAAAAPSCPVTTASFPGSVSSFPGAAADRLDTCKPRAAAPAAVARAEDMRDIRTGDVSAESRADKRARMLATAEAEDALGAA